ncbi:MAG: hypothetical protein Fur002_23250 [Anaerolineales bacterium]
MLNLVKKQMLKLLPRPLFLALKAFLLSFNPYYQRISTLLVKTSGLASDGCPFVQLESGRVFYGYLPTPEQRAYYRRFLRKEIKLRLQEDCVNVAYDIVLRYLGPAPSQDAVSQGKYYDFSAGDIVAEVGAYMGYYAMRAAELVGESGKVIAIEAVEENFSLLERNIAANRLNQITAVRKAVWNSTGALSFQRHARQQASAINGVVAADEQFSVPCDTLDNILSQAESPRPQFVRIPVNGAERETLEGMSETLKTQPTLLIAAIYERDGAPAYKDISAALMQRGYNVLVRRGNVLATPARKID